jgi:tetratricopeptide (TPR) repeat protein
MVLRLGFNKAKILQAGEKYVLQGKLAAAIDEYNKILKRDPRDLMTLNTVGDLYIRAGRSDEAIKCFYDLAEKSAEGGFLPRAIAVYKRITKIDPEAMPALTKLGELYSMQGLMRDARTHYLQAVEIFMRRGELAKARDVFEKILLLDMNNPRLQRRMAELYAETGKPREAVATYLSAAERFLDTNEAPEAVTTLGTLLKLDPSNQDAQVLRGRVYLQQGDAAKAIAALASIDSLGASKAALNTLFHAYRQAGDLDRANLIARQLFETHDDFAALALIADDLCGKGEGDKAVALYREVAERLQAQGSFGVLIEGLQKVLQADRSNVGGLELLWDAYRRAGDIGEGRETAELLAHAYVAGEQLEKAREVYAELVALEPDNPEHRRLLRQVEARLSGVESSEEHTEPVPLMAAEVASISADAVETLLPRREQELVANWLTEAELYRTYHQTERAIETLEKGLAEVPGNLALSEHLLTLYEQTQQYQKAAQCAESLTETYVKLGDGERAARYGDLAVGFQQKAQENETTQVVEPATEGSSETLPAAGVEAESEQPQVREIDLSMEWAALSESGSAAAEAVGADSIAEEVEFYLQAGMNAEASAALDRLRHRFPDHPTVSLYEERLGVSRQPASLPAETAGQEVVAEAPSESGAAQPDSFAANVAESFPTLAEPRTERAAAASPAEQEAGFALDEVFQSSGSAPTASPFELSLEEAPAAAQGSPAPTPRTTGDRFSSLAGDLEQELQLPAGPAQPTPGGRFLDDVFAEFKEDVGEPAATEDLETHYNMGVAFKEMALFDEAIGEFQKVHQLAQSAKDYSHVVQCCSLLANCFLEKGMPELAVKWYQTALDSPGVDAESALALLFEVGSAYERAGDRAAALKSFKEVYARNIDYRNVAERIRELQQSS